MAATGSSGFRKWGEASFGTYQWVVALASRRGFELIDLPRHRPASSCQEAIAAHFTITPDEGAM